MPKSNEPTREPEPTEKKLPEPLAREMFALVAAQARGMIADTIFNQPTIDALDGCEMAFFSAMAELRQDLMFAGRIRTVVREFAARYDTLHALIMQSSDTDSFTMREAVCEYNRAAATLADIGRDLEAAERRRLERLARSQVSPT